MDEMSPAELDLFLGGEDEEVQDLPRRLHVFEIMRRPDGSASLFEYLTSAEDGADGTIQAWQTQFATLDDALAYAGRSRDEPGGLRVKVFLDGVPV